MKPIKIAFDIGGVVSKYPKVFKPIIRALQASPECKVVFLTDMHHPDQSLKMLKMNGIDVRPLDIINSDFERFGESCKCADCDEHWIDLHIDDFPAYVAEGSHVRLLVMPDLHHTYYAPDWKTDGSEGDFGRRSAYKQHPK